MSTFKHIVEERLEMGEQVVELARLESGAVARQVGDCVPYYSGQGQGQIETLIEDQAQLLDLANAQLKHAHDLFVTTVDESFEGWPGQGTAALEVQRGIWQAQSRIAAQFGPQLMCLYGLEEQPPAGFRALATYAHNAVTLLQAHPQSWQGPFGNVLHTRDIVQLLAQPLLALNDYMFHFDDAPDTFKAAMQARDVAMDQWIRVWRGVSTVLEGIFLLAGRDDLAVKVRPFMLGLGAPSDGWIAS